MKIKNPQKEKFGLLPTPIYPIQGFFKEYKNYNFWIKRDDLSGLELSGNKVRKLEYIIADAIKKNSNHLISCGGIQSNHCRTVAFIAARMNFDCTLFLKGEIPKRKTGNFLLNKILNTKIIHVSKEEYQNVDQVMADYSGTLGGRGYVIPEGGSNEIGVWGYIECFFEILEQIQNQKLNIDTIVVPTGSGGTHAGLLLGKHMTDSDIHVISINVCDTSEFFVDKIYSICNTFTTKHKLNLSINQDNIHIVDGFVGEGYGMTSDKEIDIIKKFARTEAIIIDPVYTAKALHGLADITNKQHLRGENILFIHTGGIFGLFPMANKF